ncbi:MAG: V8-like Glu-specific endopeptidase [Bacteriovoracaceae bacterium]|jgi:V8-like Glu-specific endopeptidase
MKISIKQITLLAALSATAYTKADVSVSRIVYGQDNRVETYQATELQKLLANSTAGMIPSLKAIDIGTHVMLPPATIVKDFGLCADERFAEQPSAVICSGFLVGPDLLVTAGHCITNQEACDNMTWVFDYKVNEDTKKTDILVPKSNVYKCLTVIDAKLEGGGSNTRDYSLVKLDRVVEGRAPLKYRTNGKIKNSENIMVIGHPSGLPQKVADKANVYDNTKNTYFLTNLDTFGGNSGSAVFDSKTGVVEGILVRGAKDYVGADCGARVNHEAEDITGNPSLGESVSRITDVAGLMDGNKLLSASKSGDLDQVKLLAEKVKLNYTYDNEKNTALHIAVENGRNDIVEFLIKQGMNLDTQNLKGETALHIAAYVNNKFAVNKLVANGADILVKDNYGVYASERTNFLAFKLRSKLRSVQGLEIQKRRKNQ